MYLQGHWNIKNVVGDKCLCGGHDLLPLIRIGKMVITIEQSNFATDQSSYVPAALRLDS